MTGKHYILIIASILCMGISKVFGQDKNSTQGKLTATITNTTPYVGQEVVYKFTISDFINLETQPEYIKPSFENFWVNPDVGYISSDDYIVWETLIVPLYEGSIIIAPGQLRFSARADQASYQLQSNPIELFVQPLPEGAPPAFDGAVGEFDLQAAMNSQQISLGDYLELTITLRGTGNLRVIDPPTIAFPVDWVIIHGQPELIAEQRIDTNYDPNRVGITEGTKRYKWYIQFPAVGGYTIPSINFSYFNPALRQYQMIGTQTVEVEVIPSAQNALSGQARPPQLSTSSLSNWGRPIFLTHSSNSLIQFTTWGLGVVVFVLGVLSQIKSTVFSDLGNRSSAAIYHATRQRIAEYSLKHTTESIYGINQTLHAYLSQRLSTKTTSLTLFEMQELLIKAGVEERTSRMLIEQLQLSDLWRFNPSSTADVTEYGKQVAYLVSRIEQSLHP